MICFYYSHYSYYLLLSLFLLFLLFLVIIFLFSEYYLVIIFLLFLLLSLFLFSEINDIFVIIIIFIKVFLGGGRCLRTFLTMMMMYVSHHHTYVTSSHKCHIIRCLRTFLTREDLDAGQPYLSSISCFNMSVQVTLFFLFFLQLFLFKRSISRLSRASS